MNSTGHYAKAEELLKRHDIDPGIAALTHAILATASPLVARAGTELGALRESVNGVSA